MPHEVKYKKPWESTPRGNVSMLSMRSTFHSVLSSHPFVHLTNASFINLSEIRELSVSILKCTLGEPGHHANWRTLSKVSVDSWSGQMLLLKLLATPALHIFFFSYTSLHHKLMRKQCKQWQTSFGGSPNHCRWRLQLWH